MKKFSVKNNAMFFATEEEVLQVGVVSGEFDTKQIVLCAMAVFASKCEHIRFVRSEDNEQLKYCKLFITDAFSTNFPSVQSYYNVSKVWESKYKDILENMKLYTEYDYVLENAKQDLYNLENFDVLRKCNNYRDENKGFEKALKIAYEMITTILSSVASEYIYSETLNRQIENAKDEILELEINSNWRNALSKHPKANQINFVIVPENNDLYRVELVNSSIDVRKLVKGYRNLVFSGRFFAKVNSIDNAYELIDLISSKKDISKTA